MASRESIGIRFGLRSMTTITGDEEGKVVKDANGDRIGTVTEVDEGTMYVEPVPDVNATVRRVLGWNEESDGYPLRDQSIATISESVVRLRSNL